jgi:hypothetical protein
MCIGRPIGDTTSKQDRPFSIPQNRGLNPTSLCLVRFPQIEHLLSARTAHSNVNLQQDQPTYPSVSSLVLSIPQLTNYSQARCNSWVRRNAQPKSRNPPALRHETLSCLFQTNVEHGSIGIVLQDQHLFCRWKTTNEPYGTVGSISGSQRYR